MPSFGELTVRAGLWQAVRIVAACGLAYVVTGLLGLPEGYWSVITAVVVTQADLSSTLKAGYDRILGTMIGAAAGAVVIGLDAAGVLSLDQLFWLALAPLALLTAMRPNLRLSCVTLVIVVLVPSASTWHRPIDRVLEILVGSVASIVVSAVIFPRKPAVAAPAPQHGRPDE